MSIKDKYDTAIKRLNKEDAISVLENEIDSLIDIANAQLDRQEKAIKLIVQYGSIDGAYHKDWVMDQVVRALAGETYSEIVKEACDGEYGADTHAWNCGIAP